MVDRMVETYVWEGSMWTLHDNKPTTIIFGRSTSDPMVTKTFGFSNQRPYFYAPTEEVVVYKRMPLEIVETEHGYLDAFNRPVSRLYTRLPSDVPRVRNLFSFTAEADIVYDMRYLIDHKIYYGFNEKGEPVDVPMLPPRVCYFDIETDGPEDEMPDPDDPIWPIQQIQVMDSYTEDIKVYTLGGVSQGPDHVICATEEEVIMKFVDWVWHTNPDVMAGWYILGFDIPYIINRARRLKVPTHRLSRWPKSPPDIERWVGRELVDMLVFYKDWSKPMGQLPSYDLKFVCKHVTTERYEEALKKGKVAPPPMIYENFGDRIRALVQAERWNDLYVYGKNDVIALHEINKCCGLIEFYESLRRMTGIKTTDCLKRSKIIELYIMHKIASDGVVMPLPTKKHDAEKVDYEGALVLQPTFGIHEWVGTLDAKALYPSVILAYNVSPDRLKMIPKIIVELMEARDVMRRLRMEGKATDAMKMSEQSLKYVINAFYGYLAFTGARLHKPSLAAFITEEGRKIARAIHAKCIEMGYPILYADTDSGFFTGIRTPEEGIAIETAVNLHLLEWARSMGIADHLAPVVKFEKLYRTLMFKKKSDSNEAAKKRYAGVLMWKDGKDMSKNPQVDYTGLEVKRSDSAEVSRALMKRFFHEVLVNNNPQGASIDVRETYNNICTGSLPCSQVAIPKGIAKGTSHMTPGASPWVRGKEVGRTLLGIKFRADKKPKLLYLTTKNPNVVCIDDDVPDDMVRKTVSIDWRMMAHKVIEMKMRSLLESIGLSWEVEVLGQQDLQRWF